MVCILLMFTPPTLPIMPNLFHEKITIKDENRVLPKPNFASVSWF